MAIRNCFQSDVAQKQKCALTSNYCMTSWRTPSEMRAASLQLAHSRPQSPSFLGHVVGKRGVTNGQTGRLQIKPSAFGDENAARQDPHAVHALRAREARDEIINSLREARSLPGRRFQRRSYFFPPHKRLLDGKQHSFLIVLFAL